MPSWLAELEREVLRINERFNREVIEALSVCPYAKGARVAGSSVRHVSMLEAPSVGAVIEIVKGLETRDETEVAQVIFPLIGLDAAAFQEFASEVGRANAGRSPGRPVFVQAAFHPDLPFSTATPHRLVPFFRRSPDPMIQFVRLAVLDALHEGRPRGTMFFDGSLAELQAMLSTQRESVTERITRENHRRALEGEMARIEVTLADIALDRERSYGQRLGRRPAEASEGPVGGQAG